MATQFIAVVTTGVTCAYVVHTVLASADFQENITSVPPLGRAVMALVFAYALLLFALATYTLTAIATVILGAVLLLLWRLVCVVRVLLRYAGV